MRGIYPVIVCQGDSWENSRFWGNDRFRVAADVHVTMAAVRLRAAVLNEDCTRAHRMLNLYH